MTTSSWFDGKVIDHIDNWGDECIMFFTDGSRAHVLVDLSNNLKIKPVDITPHCQDMHDLMSKEFVGG